MERSDVHPPKDEVRAGEVAMDAVSPTVCFCIAPRPWASYHLSRTSRAGTSCSHLRFIPKPTRGTFSITLIQGDASGTRGCGSGVLRLLNGRPRRHRRCSAAIDDTYPLLDDEAPADPIRHWFDRLRRAWCHAQA
jgi:hypothetical protein